MAFGIHIKIILDYLHRYTSPKSQLVITALLTSVEIVINVSWLMYEPPSVTHSFPTRESRLLICEGLENYSYMVGLLYPFVLIGNIINVFPPQISEIFFHSMGPVDSGTKFRKISNGGHLILISLTWKE